MDPHVRFHQNQSKNDKVMGVFVETNLKKSTFWPTVQKTFKIGKNFDSPSEDGPSYVFSFKSVKKWQSYEHFYQKNLKKSNFWPTVQKNF